MNALIAPDLEAPRSRSVPWTKNASAWHSTLPDDARLFALFMGLALLPSCWSDPAANTSAPAAASEEVQAPPAPESMEFSEMSLPYSKIRPSAVAGSWYPSDPKALARDLDSYLGSTPPSATTPLALIMPHAGYRYSGAVAGRAASEVRGANIRRVWVMGPTHRINLQGIGLYPDEAFQTPLGLLPLDQGVNERLSQKKGFTVLKQGDRGEHSLEMELPLLQRAVGAFEIVPLLVGTLDLASAAEIAQVIRGELGPGDLVVASSDFTHFGADFDFKPFPIDDKLPARLDELDHGAWAHIANPDPQALQAYISQTGATICGRNDLVLLTALVGPTARGTELRYANSGQATGDWAHCVSYLSGRLDGPAWNGKGPQFGQARLVAPETAQILLKLARSSLTTWFEGGKMLEVDPTTLPADATRILGAFVTLNKNDQLRGCIGEITPYREIWKAIVERAVDAAIHDPRFPPVKVGELSQIEIDVSLLGPSWRVNGVNDVILGRHGIVLSNGPRRATFLPQVAPEQGWDRRTTFLHLAQKAGIPSSLIEQSTVEVYEAQVVAEHAE